MKQYTLPFRAMPKKRPRVVTKNGKTWTYNDNKYQAWLKSSKSILSAGNTAKSVNPPDGAVCMAVLMNSSRRMTGDTDNLIGAVMDAGNGKLYIDDKQVLGLLAIRNDVDTDLRAVKHALNQLLDNLPDEADLADSVDILISRPFIEVKHGSCTSYQESDE